MLFYATFTTGLGAPVGKLAAENGFDIRLSLDGALMYESKKNRKKNRFLPCFVNVFRVLAWQSAVGAAPLKSFMKAATTHPSRYGLQLCKEPSLPETFRIIVSMENRLVSADAHVKERLERLIEDFTGLKADRGGAGQEFWFLYRNEGYVFFLQRLTTHRAYEKTLPKGALRPELTYLLQILSAPSPEDVVLDPFCGHGRIPAARLQHFPCKALYASDTDENMIRETRTLLRRVTPRATAQCGPAPLLDCRCAPVETIAQRFPPSIIDKIVTDPPWGLFTETDLHTLYEEMLKNFLHVVKSGGIIVILTSQKTLLLALLSRWKAKGLVLSESYDILVSGKKAGVFVIRRR